MTQDLVKSAARALEILEVFAMKRQRMNASQLHVELGYPKSSLSGLLKSLVRTGYLVVTGSDQEYFPTLKLTRLGEWVPSALLGSESLLPSLERLRDETGETVTLTIAADLHMRCLHALPGKHPIALQVEEGFSFPMIGTAVGTMYLATQKESVVNTILERWIKHHPGQRDAIDTTFTAIAAARGQGYVTAFDIVIPDTGAIAMAMRPPTGAEPLVAAVAGLNRRIRDRELEIVEMMTRLIDTWNAGDSSGFHST
jgi:DNA-binding IclR family transcriptional regulator